MGFICCMDYKTRCGSRIIYYDKLGFNSSIRHIYRTAIDMFTIFITFTTTTGHLLYRPLFFIGGLKCFNM